jgi:hypothetical protein
MDDLHQGGNDHPFGDNHHQIVKGWNGTEGIYFFKSARYSMVCFFWSKLEHISIFMSMIGSSDPIWSVAQQSDEGCSFENTNYLFASGWNERQWLHFSRVRDVWRLTSSGVSWKICQSSCRWLGLRIQCDTWPNKLMMGIPSGMRIIFFRVEVNNGIHFSKVRDVWQLTSSGVSWKICQSSCRWLGLRIQCDTWPCNLDDMRFFGNTNQLYCIWVEMKDNDSFL